MSEDFNQGKNNLSRKERFHSTATEEKGKSKKLLYILLGLLLIAVIIVSINIVTSKDVEDDVVTTTSKSAETSESEEAVEDTTGKTNDTTEQSTETSNEKQSDSTQDNKTVSDDENKEDINESEEAVVLGEGKWKPIGTTQEEPHVSSFDKDSIDWQEKTKALIYATQLPEGKIIIWRLENGGTADTAIGTVSIYQDRHTPFQVHLKWVEKEGWMPIKVTKLDNNPYLDN